jgi:hypothetical protein
MSSDARVLVVVNRLRKTSSQPRKGRQSKEKIGGKEIHTDSIGDLKLGGINREARAFFR